MIAAAPLQAQLSCFLCARTVATILGSLVTVDAVRITRPEYADAIRRMQCPFCAGRLVVTEVDNAPPKRMTAAEWSALPIEQGRHGKPGPKTQPDITCPDCGVVAIRPTSARCRQCSASRREQQALKYRLVALLETGLPFDLTSLQQRFGTTEYALRHAITNARKDGKRIVLSGGVAKLEIAP